MDNKEQYPHYFMPTNSKEYIDIYDILEHFKVSHRIGHAIKKLLCAGRRGEKTAKKDYQESISSIQSEIEKINAAD